MPVSHYRESPEDPLELEHNAGVPLDQIPCGSPVDPLRIPPVYALTPGGSAGDSL